MCGGYSPITDISELQERFDFDTCRKPELPALTIGAAPDHLQGQPEPQREASRFYPVWWVLTNPDVKAFLMI